MSNRVRPGAGDAEPHRGSKGIARKSPEFTPSDHQPQASITRTAERWRLIYRDIVEVLDLERMLDEERRERLRALRERDREQRERLREQRERLRMLELKYGCFLH